MRNAGLADNTGLFLHHCDTELIIRGKLFDSELYPQTHHAKLHQQKFHYPVINYRLSPKIDYTV